MAFSSIWISATWTPRCRPSAVRAVGSPGAKRALRARYGLAFPAESRIASLFAMLAAMLSRRIRWATMPLVETSSDPYMEGHLDAFGDSVANHPKPRAEKF